MTDRFFDFSRTIDRMRQGPLGKHVDTFATLLVDQGFGRLTGRFQIRVVADFSRWLERRRIAVPSIDASVIERYGVDYQRKYALWSHRPPILQRFLGMLNEQGVAPRTECPAIQSPRQEEIEAYRLYLQQERGLSERTIPNMVAFAELFLAEQFPKDRPDFAALGPRDVTRFVERQATRVKSGTAKLMVTALRAYFRYLRHRGDIQTDLAACIPPVAPYSVSPLPSFLPAGAVEKILAHCDRSTPLGKRDYAVLLLLARLGLRNGEIIGMNLEDIDWDVGEVTIRGKGGRRAEAPAGELMPSVRVYQKKQLRLDLLNFRQNQMFKVGNVGVAAVKNRLSAAQGPADSPAKPLTKRYAIRKTKLGKGNRRTLSLTGDMLRNFMVRTVSENKAKASLSTRKDRIKAWINQKIEPWVVLSPRNRSAVTEATRRILIEMKPRLVIERMLGGKQR